ncbi:hypothetical protein RRG08_029143 [Elysia crispata]|uniref:Uncharacterized protein n=1 Tax=Elysia crispata TaxID=231223 RepID=A0AAE0Y695_9GAST|nr:hypothetical protein RRG08_029143 [Elysia crispata]
MAEKRKEGVNGNTTYRSRSSASDIIPETSNELSFISSHPSVRNSELDLNNSTHISHQLMYSEKFAECYKTDKLKIVGKETHAASQTFHMPQNSVLSRIKEFLPQLSQANKKMASDIASKPDQQETLTIEPFTLGNGESDDDNDEKGEDGESCESNDTKKSLDQKTATVVEMNVALVPPEVLTMFDDDDSSSSSDESTSEAKVDESMSVLQQKEPQTQNGSSLLISSVEELSSSDVTVKDVAPNR